MTHQLPAASGTTHNNQRRSPDPEPGDRLVRRAVERSGGDRPGALHSPSTPPVVSTAASWSRLLGAKVRLLDVVEDQREMPGAWEPTKRLATTLTGLGYDAMPEVLVADDPAEAIVRTAGHLGGPLLVVGTHGHPEMQHPALGRVSMAVVRSSPCPVLVVPDQGSRDES